MARFNTTQTIISVTGTTSLSYVINNVTILLTGTPGYTLTLASPTPFSGLIQNVYNATGGNVTITASTGAIIGNGFTSAISQTIPNNSSFTLTSNGTNYIISNNEGGPQVIPQLTINGANLNTDISPTGTSTVTIGPASTLTLGTAGQTSTFRGNLSAITANQTVTISPTGTGSITMSPAGSGSFTPATTLTLGTSGQTTTMNGNLSAITANQTITLSPTGTGSVTMSPATTGSFTPGSTLTLGTAGQTTTMNGNISVTGSNQTVNFSPTGAGTITINPSTTSNINNVNIGASTRGTGAFTSLAVNSTASFTSTVTVPTPTAGTDATNKNYVDGRNPYTSLAFNDASTTYDTFGNITGFVSNGITYSLITYQRVDGLAAGLGGTYYRPVTWREVDTFSGTTKNMTATYAASGRVSSLTVA
jgi:hypothetical protein